MINIIEANKLVIKNMLEKKSRVFFTVIGIIIGIFTFTFFIFVSQGLSNAINEQFTSLGTGIVGVQPADQGLGIHGGKGLTDTEISKIKQVISEYKYVVGGIAYSGQWEYSNIRKNILSISYPDEHLTEVFEDIGIKIKEGRNLRRGDKGNIVIGYKTATETFNDKKISIGSSIKINNKNFRVIGIFKEQGDLIIDSSSFISFNDAKELANQNTYSLIRIRFLETADINYYTKQIDKKLNPNGKAKKVNITSADQAIKMFDQILGLLTGIIGFISSIALIVGGINVMNTMYSNVIERKNEISVMKAIGATNFDIMITFLIESSILGILGGFIGFISAFSFAKILSYLIINFTGYNVPIYFEINFFLIIVLGTTLISTAFGTYPAVKAAKINPADNLRDE